MGSIAECYAICYRRDMPMFKGRYSEGCTELIIGEGKWIEDKRIGRILAFQGTDKVVTLEYHEVRRSRLVNRYDMRDIWFWGENTVTFTECNNPVENVYSQEEFTEYVQKNQVGLGSPMNVLEIIDAWRRRYPDDEEEGKEKIERIEIAKKDPNKTSSEKTEEILRIDGYEAAGMFANKLPEPDRTNCLKKLIAELSVDIEAPGYLLGPWLGKLLNCKR